MFSARVVPQTVPVTAGVGEIAATAGGQQSFSLVRFIHGNVTIHAGDTVEWTNLDPEIGHTITFGPIPQDLIDPSCSPDCVVSTDPDGALHATVISAQQNVHSGLIAALLEDEQVSRRGPVAPPMRFSRHPPDARSLPLCLRFSRQSRHGGKSDRVALTESP
jgi:plastocyanin